MTKPLIAIITGSSNSGSFCLEELFAKYSDKVRVRVGFRTEEKAKQYRDKYPQLEIVVGVDGDHPDSMNSLFQNVQSALIVTPYVHNSYDFERDSRQSVNMINAAANNGVKYIVYVGSLSCSHPEKMTILSSRFKPSEDLLIKLEKEKGIKWTSLRGGAFMGNLFWQKDSIKNENKITMAKYPTAYVDTRDIGKCAALCLISDSIEHHGKYYELTGPDLFTGKQVAELLTKILGRDIKYNELTLDIIKASMPKFMVEMYESSEQEDGNPRWPANHTVKGLIGEHGTLEQFLIRHKSAFI